MKIEAKMIQQVKMQLGEIRSNAQKKTTNKILKIINILKELKEDTTF